MSGGNERYAVDYGLGHGARETVRAQGRIEVRRE